MKRQAACGNLQATQGFPANSLGGKELIRRGISGSRSAIEIDSSLRDAIGCGDSEGRGRPTAQDVLSGPFGSPNGRIWGKLIDREKVEKRRGFDGL
jgi:hypothetical protein